MTKHQKIIVSAAILALALFLRIWQLEERMVFSGETNNILYYVESYLKGDKPILMGLEAAQYVHHLFHLPWYLWLMIPLFVFGLGSPLVFAWFQALVGMFNAFLLYRIGSRWSRRAGMLAALLYAVWMKTITIDRFVSPVSLVPFGVIVSLWLFLRVRSRPSVWSFLAVGFWIGVAVSFHYALLAMVLMTLVWIGLMHRRYFISTFIGVIVAFSPIIIFDLGHQFFNLTGLWYVGRSLFDQTRPYGSSHFVYQLLPLVVIGGAILLTRLPRVLVSGALFLFLIVQGRAFLRYHVSPNFAERKAVVTDILGNWDEGIQVYFKDESSFDYGYLLRYEVKRRGLEPKLIEIYEPWQPENSATVVVENDHVSKRSTR